MGQQCLHVYCDSLCLMALFRDVMLLVHDWAALSTWTGTGIAEKLPGNSDIWEVLIVIWIVCAAVMNGRSKNWRWW